MAKPLIHISDEELKAAIAKQSERVVFSYSDLIAEYDRRVSRRATRATLMLSVVSLAIAAGAFTLAFVRP